MAHIKIPIEARFLRIPTKWERRKAHWCDERGEHTEHLLVPEVDSAAKPTRIDNPWKLRVEFLKMKHSEDAALSFLNEVGIWSAVEGEEPQSGLEKTAFSIWAGHGHFSGRALPLSIEELWSEQERWLSLLSNESKIRAEFSPDRGNKLLALQTRFGNTLSVHMEWRPGKKQMPQAVIQPMTGQELLTATAWIDLVNGAEFQVCENCGTPFTGRKRKHCSEPCAHAVAVRAYRKRLGKSGRKHKVTRGT